MVKLTVQESESMVLLHCFTSFLYMVFGGDKKKLYLCGQIKQNTIKNEYFV